MPEAIEARNLGKVFKKRRSLRDMVTHPFARPGRVRALEDVNFQVRQGEIFGLLGPNGAGKTTLLKILSSLVIPSEGVARVNGHDVVGAQQTVRASIGLVTSDERSFYWRLSGRENLHFFAALYNVPRRHVRERCNQLLEKMDLTAKADQAFMEYSTGTKQRLAIARALLHDPPIIFMDEPTRSLDPAAAKHLREFIAETLNGKERKTILLATHNLAEAEILVDRLAILHLSRIRRMGTLSEVRTLGSTRERYEIEISEIGPEQALAAGFGEVQVEAVPEGGVVAPGSLLLKANVARGGEELTELLRRLLDGGATILTCSRREATLAEVFDLVASEGPEDAAAAETEGGT